MADIPESEFRGGSKAMRAPTPEEFLHQLHADFTSQAEAKEAEARDLEDRMMRLRAEAAGLRTAAMGLADALEVYASAVARNREFMDKRDGLESPGEADRGSKGKVRRD